MTVSRPRALGPVVVPADHPKLNRPSPADRLRLAADAAHGNAVYGEGRVTDLRRHSEDSEAYLDRMASALRRAGYVVHAPGEEMCVPYSESAATVSALEARLSAADSIIVALETDLAAALRAPGGPTEGPAASVTVLVPVKTRKPRSVPLPTAGSNAHRLLAAYAEDQPLFGEEGMTASEAAASAALPAGAWKRVSDLATLGLVGPLMANDAHVTRRRDGDRQPARVWVITAAGHTHLAALAGHGS